MSELPTKIRIMGLDYSVLYVSEASQVDIHRRESLVGQIDYFSQTIRIYDGGGNLDPTAIRQAIWHEIVHGICYGLHISTGKGDLTNDERAVDLLATGICCVLQDNPQLREWGRDDGRQ